MVVVVCVLGGRGWGGWGGVHRVGLYSGQAAGAMRGLGGRARRRGRAAGGCERWGGVPEVGDEI
jgi:hypothetical protein